MIYDIVIIGAGASGLMAASELQKQNLSICIIDSNKKIGEKIKISGGGKCNITNKYMNENYFLGDKNFISNTLKNFTQNDLLKFLNQNDVYPKINEKIVKGTYFCNSSSDVISMFKKLTQKCVFKLDTKVIDVDYKNENYIIETNNNIVKSKKLIVASGGVSYPIIGASDIGFKIAQKFGHNIIKLNPALVGFTVQKINFGLKI